MIAFSHTFFFCILWQSKFKKENHFSHDECHFPPNTFVLLSPTISDKIFGIQIKILFHAPLTGSLSDTIYALLINCLGIDI